MTATSPHVASTAPRRQARRGPYCRSHCRSKRPATIDQPLPRIR
jgi:hypothetical protein